MGVTAVLVAPTARLAINYQDPGAIKLGRSSSRRDSGLLAREEPRQSNKEAKVLLVIF